MPTQQQYLTTLSLLLLIAVCLPACSPKTTTAELPVKAPAAFSGSGAAELPADWWASLGDTALNRVMDTALTNNFNLVVAWERLQAARAVVERESASLFPDLRANIQSALNFPQPDFVGGENVRLGLRSQYEVDLWGRIHSLVDAERFRRDASGADYQAAAISLSAEVARAWYQLAEARGQLAIVNAQLRNNEKILRLIRQRLGTGQVRSVDVLRQEQLLAGTREQKTYIRANIRLLENRLSVLLGDRPQDALPALPDTLRSPLPLPATGIPLDLVRQRPDLQRAFYQVQAADEELAAAISNKYPRLSLNASTSLRSNNFRDVLDSWAYSLAGNIAAPLLNAGQLRAEVDRSRSVRQQRLYEYGQATLTAFREVEDALAQEQNQAQAITALEDQLRLARRAYEQLRLQYFNGTSTYLDVLTALDQMQQLRRDLLSARYLLMDYRIALCRALAAAPDATPINRNRTQ
ncbi:MAG: efflux transporter outer membrane subunit [Bacteroidetes bacterium]|jgi:NodT family efflux transporter outer membrane factor (OMF) lipoprotein|nr:efflux transporter outer membrane subunit [Bacteroidota bacterium]